MLKRVLCWSENFCVYNIRRQSSKLAGGLSCVERSSIFFCIPVASDFRTQVDSAGRKIFHFFQNGQHHKWNFFLEHIPPLCMQVILKWKVENFDMFMNIIQNIRFSSLRNHMWQKKIFNTTWGWTIQSLKQAARSFSQYHKDFTK